MTGVQTCALPICHILVSRSINLTKVDTRNIANFGKLFKLGSEFLAVLAAGLDIYFTMLNRNIREYSHFAEYFLKVSWDLAARSFDCRCREVVVVR